MGNKVNVILSVGGFDPTGGAGINLDCHVCTKCNSQQVAVISSIVIQDPLQVKKVIRIHPPVIFQQLTALSKYYNFAVINIGIFGSIKVLSRMVNQFGDQKIILDPIIKSGSGRFVFLKDKEIRRLKKYLAKFYLITPNIPEAEKLTGIKIHDTSGMQQAALLLNKEYGIKNILIKGGHLIENHQDLLYCQGKFYFFKSSSRDFRIHGTGSFLNAAVSCRLLAGDSLFNSVATAKNLLDRCISRVSPDNPLLNHS